MTRSDRVECDPRHIYAVTRELIGRREGTWFDNKTQAYNYLLELMQARPKDTRVNSTTLQSMLGNRTSESVGGGNVVVSAESIEKYASTVMCESWELVQTSAEYILFAVKKDIEFLASSCPWFGPARFASQLLLRASRMCSRAVAAASLPDLSFQDKVQIGMHCGKLLDTVPTVDSGLELAWGCNVAAAGLSMAHAVESKDLRKASLIRAHIIHAHGCGTGTYRRADRLTSDKNISLGTHRRYGDVVLYISLASDEHQPASNEVLIQQLAQLRVLIQLRDKKGAGREIGRLEEVLKGRAPLKRKANFRMLKGHYHLQLEGNKSLALDEYESAAKCYHRLGMSNATSQHLLAGVYGQMMLTQGLGECSPRKIDYLRRYFLTPHPVLGNDHADFVKVQQTLSAYSK